MVAIFTQYEASYGERERESHYASKGYDYAYGLQALAAMNSILSRAPQQYTLWYAALTSHHSKAAFQLKPQLL